MYPIALAYVDEDRRHHDEVGREHAGNPGCGAKPHDLREHPERGGSKAACAGQQHVTLVVGPRPAMTKPQAVEHREQHQGHENPGSERFEERRPFAAANKLHLHADDDQSGQHHRDRERQTRHAKPTVHRDPARRDEPGLQGKEQVPEEKRPAMYMHCGRHGRIGAIEHRPEVRERESQECNAAGDEGEPQVRRHGRHHTGFTPEHRVSASQQ